MKAKLVLEDGTIFEGIGAGAPVSTAGEVVFATGIVGYDLSLTDPSFAGQILVFTYPLIGNWGVPDPSTLESQKIHVAGVVVSDLATSPSHWQSQKTLDAWLKSQNVPLIAEVDTRALTHKIRQHGVMLGKIIQQEKDVKFENPNIRNLVAEVSPKKLTVHKPTLIGPQSKGRGPHGPVFSQLSTLNLKIGLLNCGAKENIKNNLLKRGVQVYEMPWDFDPFEKGLKLDGLIISNGPGDPKMAVKSIAVIKKALRKKLPTFGICLGNQLLALAAGGDTYKLKFGHRAQNQPTIEVGTKRCFITTQNHGFAVDEKKMPEGFRSWFINANDGTNEGIIHKNLPFFSVQFHPEARPGPTDTEFLFDFFLEKIAKS